MLYLELPPVLAGFIKDFFTNLLGKLEMRLTSKSLTSLAIAYALCPPRTKPLANLSAS
jgi:hypothetical protein